MINTPPANLKTCKTENNAMAGCKVECDIVLPVYNGLTYVKDCVASLLEYTNPDSYHLFIIDDFSDKITGHYLSDIAAGHSNITIHRNSGNLGFVKSCNLGISLGLAPYVLILNSDVVVTPGWLDRLIECVNSDQSIASVNPLTNYASQINLPLAPGANFFGMDKIVKENSSNKCADVVTGVGFCMLLRRSALEKVGTFDEVYDQGYCEDSDLCMRLTASGYRTVVADNVYVYHKGRGAFKDRDARYKANRRIFDSRWEKEYSRQFKNFLESDPFGSVRRLFSLKKRFDPMPYIWLTAREILDKWWKRDIVGIAGSFIRGLLNLPNARRRLANQKSISRVTRSGRPRITYVLHNLVIAGGVLSVIQLVNELILQGIEARIVGLFEDPAIYNWTRLYTKPVIFKNRKELIENFPETDIAVATHWSTANWAFDLVKTGRVKDAAYFIQDYEPWFFRDEEKESREKVMDTYRMIENKIVKSEWLQSKLAQDGFSAKKISLGMDLGRFYPRDVQKSGVSVLVMARPNTPRRGFSSIIEALAIVKKTMPEVRIVLFGDRFLAWKNIPFNFVNQGVVTDQDQLAGIYSEANVFLDGSDFQGFGRCGLEAMACGTPCVLTGVGGVTEYARDGKNSLIVPPKRPDIFAEAIMKLLKDPDLRHRLSIEGLNTAQKYCHKREAKETLEYFHQIMEKQK